MKVLCTILLLVPHVLSAQISISEARKLKTGKVVTVNGHVTATFGELSFIQDPGAAIAVYGVMLHENDSVSITGKLSKFNGQLEIITDSVRVIGNRPPIAPKIVTSIIAHESGLVQLKNVMIHPQGLFFYPERAGLLIAHDSIQYWIDGSTDIPGYMIPHGATSVTGVVGRFGDRLQIIPRSHLDIQNIQYPIPITNDHFRVVNWNVEFFGAIGYGPSNNNLQIENVSRVLKEVRPDLAALQEVSSDEAFKSLLDLLPGYEGRCSNRYSYSFDTNNDFPPQKLCFIYNTSTVKVIREKILFRRMFDLDPSDIFSSGRLPYLLEVDVMDHRLLFVNYHGKSGASPEDYRRREYDSELLEDSLDWNKDMVLLGDFNDDVDVSIVDGLKSPYGFAGDLCITKPLSKNGWHSTLSYDDMIDHQVVSSSMKEYYVDGSASVVNPFGIISKYGTTTSDHLPVMSEFDLTKLVTGVTTPPDNQVKVFPNPAVSEAFFIPDIADATMINSMGIVVFKKEGAHSPISLREYAPGIYTLILDNQVVRLIKY
jgi:endonuclease/exonuclease/phosphatase family metal-dependent hydrolase